MYIDFNQIARLGKLIALIGFFLPWVTVSCSSTEILSATGWQLMTGDPQPAGPLEGMQSETEDADPNVFVVAAFTVVLIGLITSFFTRTQSAAITMLVCAVLGIGISYYSIENMRSELRQEMSERSEEAPAEENVFFSAEQQRQLSRSMASAITVKEEEGYVVTHTGLLIAAIFSLLTLFRRKRMEETPPSDSARP